MSEIIAQSHNSEAITSFHVTKNLKYILYTSLYCNQSAKKYGKLQLFNRDTGKTTLLRGQISIVEEKLDYSLSPINVLEVPVLVNAKGNKKVTKVSWVLMNTGDGIEAVSYTHLDVYKRQHQTFLCEQRRIILPIWSSDQIR